MVIGSYRHWNYNLTSPNEVVAALIIHIQTYVVRSSYAVRGMTYGVRGIGFGRGSSVDGLTTYTEVDDMNRWYVMILDWEVDKYSYGMGIWWIPHYYM